MAIDKANPRAVGAVSDLCIIHRKRFSWLVGQVLNDAVGWQREYELAYYTVDRYPGLQDLVASWLKDSLKASTMDLELARELLKAREDRAPDTERGPLVIAACARDKGNSIPSRREGKDRGRLPAFEVAARRATSGLLR